MSEILDEIADRRCGPVRARSGRALVIVAAINDAPDATTLTIAAGMCERHFVMTDDAVVEVGDVQGPIGTELDMDRAEPRIIRLKKSLKYSFWSRTVPLDGELVDAMADDIADVGAALIGLGKMIGVVESEASHGGRFRVAVVHLRRQTEAIVGRAETRIPAAAQQLIDRLRVTVGRVEIAQRIEGDAEWIDLAVRELLDVAAIGPDAVGVAGSQGDRTAVLGLDGRFIRETVTGVDPAIETPGERTRQSVRVAVADARIKHLPAIGVFAALAVA